MYGLEKPCTSQSAKFSAPETERAYNYESDIVLLVQLDLETRCSSRARPRVSGTKSSDTVGTRVARLTVQAPRVEVCAVWVDRKLGFVLEHKPDGPEIALEVCGDGGSILHLENRSDVGFSDSGASENKRDLTASQPFWTSFGLSMGTCKVNSPIMAVFFGIRISN